VSVDGKTNAEAYDAMAVGYDAQLREWGYIQTRDLYNFRSRSYWLRRFENYGRKERVAVDGYTIEHIMPQNEEVPSDWRTTLSPEWQRVHDEWLHTLSSVNPSVSAGIGNRGIVFLPRLLLADLLGSAGARSSHG
jgi:hypothetical protein